MRKIAVTQPLFSGKEVEYVTDCIKSTWVSSGKYIELFEKKFATFCNTSYASTCSSGTTALHLVFLALKIKKNDEVIIPDLTYVSTANVIKYVGARPILVDVDRNIWTINPKKIEAKITKNTKAIVAVHLYGHPADMDSINLIAKKHNLIVIEDACEAHGALYNGKKVGSLSKVGCFSFSGAKIITTGEGGMIVSKDKDLMMRIESIRSNFIAKSRHFFHSDVGYPYRFTNIQAALGLAQLEKITTLMNIKIKNARIYNTLFKDEEVIQLPPQKSWAKNIFWLYSIVLKKSGLRDKLIYHLEEKGIQTRPFFVPIHKLPMYKNREKFPNSDFLSENGISLPSGLTLDSRDIERICNEVKIFLKTHA
ncbi:MAG: DegT/DnrJ/EryC1/StrS family aminotransferase [Patescibacteria group bacterium]|nr:DegT/DnrJ/EryC1/StrS family aminotransferase [Patescibacteria group bacterium]